MLNTQYEHHIDISLVRSVSANASVSHISVEALRDNLNFLSGLVCVWRRGQFKTLNKLCAGAGLLDDKRVLVYDPGVSRRMVGHGTREKLAHTYLLWPLPKFTDMGTMHD